jgi:TatD DNase family protein
VIPMIDAHLHLAQYPPEQLERLIESWQQHGISQVVAVSTDVRSAHQTLELQHKHPDFVLAAVGWHPEQALPSSAEREEIVRLIRTERDNISAIGEVGLPHYELPRLGEQALPDYADLLGEFARLSAEAHLPLVLHAVHDKAAQALAILREHRALPSHFHWLKAPLDVVDEIIAAGHYISVTPEVIYRERAQDLCRRVPLERLLLETDGPWPYPQLFPVTEPVPMTTPLLLFESAATVAALHGISAQELFVALDQNIRDLYRRKTAR